MATIIFSLVCQHCTVVRLVPNFQIFILVLLVGSSYSGDHPRYKFLNKNKDLVNEAFLVLVFNALTIACFFPIGQDKLHK